MGKNTVLRYVSHAMRAVKVLCRKHYKHYYLTTMHRITTLFAAEALLELDRIVDSLLVITNG